MEGCQIFVSISKLKSVNPIFKSEPLPLTRAAANTLEWGPLKNVLLEQISLFYDGKYVIDCKIFPEGTTWFQLELIYFNFEGSTTNTIEHEMQHGSVTLETTLVKHTGFVCATFKLHHIRLYYNPEKLFNFLKIESKICIVACVQLREWNTSKQMCQRLIYLGRAQRVSTKCNKKTRFYSWLSKTNEDVSSFPGIRMLKEDDWEHHLQDYADMTKLRLKISDSVYPSALTHRNSKDCKKNGGGGDGDLFSNPFRVLPVPFNCENAPLFTFKFFNLASDHPAHSNVETSFKLTEAFISKEISSHLSIQVENTQFGLTEIRLIVKNYQSTLLFFNQEGGVDNNGDNGGPLTI